MLSNTILCVWSREFCCFRSNVIKRQLESSPGRTSRCQALPRRLYHYRDIDKSDPDDWWGASMDVGRASRSHGHSTDTRNGTSSSHTDDQGHHESDFWYFHSTNGKNPKPYYYHEYHYMHYYHRTQYKAGARVEVSSPENALEMASRSFAIALEAAAIEMQNTCTDVSLEDLERTITREIGKVAEYCGSDIVSFARVIGVLDVNSVGDSPNDEALVRKARKSIVFRFHPDKVNNLKDSGKRLSYLLGQSILQALSTMKTR